MSGITQTHAIYLDVLQVLSLGSILQMLIAPQPSRQRDLSNIYFSVVIYEVKSIVSKVKCSISDPLSFESAEAQSFGLVVRRKSFYHCFNIWVFCVCMCAHFVLVCIYHSPSSQNWIPTYLAALCKNASREIVFFATCVSYRKCELAFILMSFLDI